MIIIDTSVWIEFFKQHSDYVNEIALLLESKMVVTVEPIFSELLYGAKGNKEKGKILAYWKVLPKIKFTEGSFIECAEFANTNNYQSIGIGLMDAIICRAAIQNQYKLWTLDKKIIKSLDKKALYK
jgi:predicted nucleic acid-binding protein